MPAERDIEAKKVSIYANSILEVCGKDADSLIAMRSSIEGAVKASYSNGERMANFADQSINEKKRFELAKAAFSALGDEVSTILAIMATRGDIYLLGRVFEEFTRLAENSLGAVMVDVTTCVELDDDLRKLISQKLAADFGLDAILVEHIDPQIIGGIIMSARGRKIDASIATMLESSRVILSSSPAGGDR